MIFPQTRLVVADNTGAKLIQCIGMLGKKKVASVGRIITVSVKSVRNSSAKVKPGEVHRALVVRTKKHIQRSDGQFVRFDDNAAIILTPDFSPLGTRITGPVSHELLNGNWAKVVSLATRVI
jgi:large subunit ribosomal protein L14